MARQTAKNDAAPAHPDIAAMAFEAAMAELETIVGRLERGDVPLEAAIGFHERGEALRKHCEALLRTAEARIEKIGVGPDGAPKGVEPLDPERT